MPNQLDRKIPATDGFELAVTLYEPEHSSKHAVIINSATAVPRAFYEHFASYLAEQGFTVITYDYRGIGGSRPASLKRFQARMQDWSLKDMQGIVDWVVNDIAADKITMIGHSIGGQQAGLIRHTKHINALVTMSAQSGYWKLQGGNERFKNIIQVNVLIPLLSRLFGYFPWSKLAAGEDLPKGVALEWAKWCQHPNYLLGDTHLPLDRYSEFQAPVLAYSFADDNWGTARSVKVNWIEKQQQNSLP